MKLIVMGPQASGKGTQAKILSKKLNIPHISTGDMLRETTGELRRKIDSYIVGGNLFPDELMFEILKQRLAKSDCQNGFVLDGFPRNSNQANILSKLIEIDNVIEVNISDEEAIRRLSGRRSCNNCGKIYNLNTAPIPKEKGICDSCGGELLQREDDYPEFIKKRLEIYHKQTKPLLEKYNTIKINGEQDIEKVSQEIIEKINL